MKSGFENGKTAPVFPIVSSGLLCRLASYSWIVSEYHQAHDPRYNHRRGHIDHFIAGAVRHRLYKMQSFVGFV